MFLQQLNCYKAFIFTPIDIKRRKVVGRAISLKGKHYIVAVSFIGGGNNRTRRKSPSCRKSLTNFIT
jgi:hypothetical protein